MAKQIAPQIKQLLLDGFKPWGMVIPDPINAPKGSAAYQFKRGRDSASFVITPSGRVVRGATTIKGVHKQFDC